MLRCRPYDICFVVSAHPALEDAIGRVVRVTVIDVQQGGRRGEFLARVQIEAERQLKRRPKAVRLKRQLGINR